MTFFFYLHSSAPATESKESIKIWFRAQDSADASFRMIRAHLSWWMLGKVSRHSNPTLFDEVTCVDVPGFVFAPPSLQVKTLWAGVLSCSSRTKTTQTYKVHTGPGTEVCVLAACWYFSVECVRVELHGWTDLSTISTLKYAVRCSTFYSFLYLSRDFIISADVLVLWWNDGEISLLIINAG